MDTTPSEQTERTTDTQEIAGNMAMVFADQIKKGLIPWYSVPKSLRSTVNALLNRSE